MSAQRIEGLDLDALERWFAEHVEGFAGQLDAELVSGGKSNLTYRLTDGRSSWVLRRPPLGMLTPSAHDMAREYRVVAALHGTPVPVARPVGLLDPSVTGVQCAIVEFVPGAVLRTEDDLAPYTDEQVRACAMALVDTLAALHAIDPAEVGLAEFGKPAGYLARQIRRWYGQWERVRTRDLPDLEALHTELQERCPAESGAAIVHGDFRIDNTIVDPDDPAVVRAVVDWEMATLGDPLADLAMHVVYSDPAFSSVLGGSAASTSPRMPDRREIVERYRAASGRDVGEMSFHLGLAYFKLAVIAEGIHRRYVDGDTRGEGFATVGEAPPPLAAAGRKVLGGGW